MARFGLEEEEQVAVFLRLFVVGEEAFLEFEAVCKVVGDFVLLDMSVVITQTRRRAHLFQCHAVLDEQGYARVEIAHILFEDKVLLGLRRDLGLEFAEYLLSCRQLAYRGALQSGRVVPLARSSSISSSLSLADMDRYRAVTE